MSITVWVTASTPPHRSGSPTPVAAALLTRQLLQVVHEGLVGVLQALALHPQLELATLVVPHDLAQVRATLHVGAELGVYESLDTSHHRPV
jgi:hypothetical protein